MTGAIYDTKNTTELNSNSVVFFECAIRETIEWYRGHSQWLEHVTSGVYQSYYNSDKVQ